MKNIKLGIIASIVLSILFASCKKLDDLSTSPNSPSTVPASSLLGTIEVATFATYGTGFTRTTNILTQQLTGTNLGQYGAFTDYILLEGDFVNDWITLYSNAMVNAKNLSNQYGEGSPYYNGMAKVLLAANLGVATDMFGDVPYSEALDGENLNFTPHFDSQESILAAVQSLLDEAITEFNKPASSNVYLPGSDDLIYGGDVEMWKSAAYMLKARYALRLTKKGASSAATNALSYLSSAGVTGSENDMNAIYFGGSTSSNQWADFQVQRADYIKMGAYFIDLMQGSADPRLPYFASLDGDGGYSGTTPEDKSNISTSDIGPAINDASAPQAIISYVECKFIEAEANLILGNTVSAQAAFEEAVSASLIQVTGADDAAFVAAATATLDVENIITQKYIALFTRLEPYNDYRRTGFPALTPNTDASIATIPARLPISSDERTSNPNAVTESITTPVWWAQ